MGVTLVAQILGRGCRLVLTEDKEHAIPEGDILKALDLKQLVKQHREEVLAILRGELCTWCGHDPIKPISCYWGDEVVCKEHTQALADFLDNNNSWPQVKGWSCTEFMP